CCPRDLNPDKWKKLDSLFLTVTHSLRYFYSSSSGVSNFPEFVAVGLVDDVQMIHYDSNAQKAEFKQQWMEKAAEDDPEYSFLMKLFNQTKMSHLWENIKYFLLLLVSGVHINQMMYGCEWDDETAEVNGYHQYGYDGEDFISFDLQTETWIAPVTQAVITKLEWDSDRSYVNYGRNGPGVSLGCSLHIAMCLLSPLQIKLTGCVAGYC
uniref:MHC class I-like antigen recognition-like domain-containing protein n=1 Tax=Oreochromis niloticus TaxID=8128 RepID=A0A669E0T7_ORENI